MTESIPDDAPAPRLCHIRKRNDFSGYGFNLHADKGKAGQYIGKVDDGSPAYLAGLREGDRIIEVNGTNIGSENHQQVVQRIKAVPDETKFLVLDDEADVYYKLRNIVVRSDMPNVKSLRTPLENEESDHDDLLDPTYKVRLCHMKIWPNFSGYGFNLHADKGSLTQYIGKVDPDSPADAAGLRENDQLIEVNGINVQEDSHPEVVKKVKSDPNQVTMLVVDAEAFKYFQGRGIKISNSMEGVVKLTCPDRNSNSDRNSEIEEQTLAPVVESPFVDELPTTLGLQSSKEELHPYTIRQCHLKSWHDGKGYGFNMQAEKGKPGQFIAKVDEGSPADLAGLRGGDRIIEVNGISVAQDSHKQVVEQIKSNSDETILLVVDPIADEYFGSREIILSGSLPFVEKIVCPDSNPNTAAASSNDDISDNKDDNTTETMTNGIAAFSVQETKSEMEEQEQHEYSHISDTQEEEAQQYENSFESKPFSLSDDSKTRYASEIEKGEENHKEEISKTATVSVVNTSERENLSAETKPDKSALTLNITTATTVDNSKTIGSPSSAGSQKSTPVESPKSPVTVGGITFAATAEEARKKMTKKKSADSNRMSIQAKYDLFKKL